MLSNLPNYMVNLRYFSITGQLPYEWINVAAFGQLKSLRSFELKCEYYEEWRGYKWEECPKDYNNPIPFNEKYDMYEPEEYEQVPILDNIGVRGVHEVTRVLHIMIFWSAYQSSCEI